jgi:8-oxo-dGTP diphosphatase
VEGTRVTLYVVRHGEAGEREEWTDDDDLRPLTKRGRRQAEALCEVLLPAAVTRIVSSPAVRCRQTVEPLAARMRLPVDLSEGLAEGARFDETLALVDKVANETSVLCTHGDVIGSLLWHAERHGVDIGAGRMKKGSTWVFDLEAGAIVRAEYVPPPA